MTEKDLERFYYLLPTLYQQRDLTGGEQLRALVAVLESEFRALEADMEALYDNWFIQTCDTWVIPYIADLVGLRGLSQQKHLFSTQRRQVADTIGYRRRKGTLSVIEHIMKDVTGWYVYAVEFFQHMAITQRVDGAGAARPGCVDLRRMTDLAELNGPFDRLAHTVDIRHIQRRPTRDAEQHTLRQGRYNLANIGLFVWRLRSYAMRDSFARAVPQRRVPPGQRPPVSAYDRYGHYTFHPLGCDDLPLFNQPQMITAISQRIEAASVPAPLMRAAFAADTDEYANRYGERPEPDQPPNSIYYGPDRGLNIVDARYGGPPRPIPPVAVVGMDLTGWQTDAIYEVFESCRGARKQAAIDVELGRLVVFPPKDAGELAGWSEAQTGDLIVTYTYGFSGEISGGSYHRRLAHTTPTGAHWVAGVAKGTSVDTLQEALRQWDGYCRACEDQQIDPQGIICILDNGVYDLDAPIQLPAGASLTIVADNGVRPIIGPASTLVVACAAVSPTDRRTRRFGLNGLLIDGGIEIGAASPEAYAAVRPNVGRLEVTIEQCTLMPLGLNVSLDKNAARVLQVSISQSITGPLFLPSQAAGLTASDTIIDAGKGTIVDNELAFAIAADAGGAAGPPLTLQRATVFGQVHVVELATDDTIFTAPVTATHRGAGGPVRHSYVPDGSKTPEREHCQPAHGSAIRPVFTSTRYRNPAYAQLSQRCPREIRRGAADGSEMGAFHDLYQSQAEDNIQAALEEYLPFDLHAGVIYVT